MQINEHYVCIILKGHYFKRIRSSYLHRSIQGRDPKGEEGGETCGILLLLAITIIRQDGKDH